MSIDLSNKPHIATALFVKIVVPDYDTLLFSNYHKPLTIYSENYAGLGQLIAITSTSSELKVSTQELTITISGIPQQNISDVLDYRFKGSRVYVYRGIFNTTTGTLLNDIGQNPTGKFQGVINNFSLNEDWSGQSASNTIGFVCTSTVGLLDKKIGGRRTNPNDQKFYYPTDNSFNRVPTLANSNFNFGAVIR